MKKMQIFSHIFIVVGFLSFFSHSVLAKEYKFDPLLLDDGKDNVKADIDILNSGGQLPGDYFVNIRVNGKIVAKQMVKFVSNGIDLSPCLQSNELPKFGINKKYFDEKQSNQRCIDLSSNQKLKVNYDYNHQNLDIFVPDKFLLSTSIGVAPQELWDDGVPAFLMGYKTYIQRTQLNSFNSNSYMSRYVQLTPGVNVGGWRLRNSSSWDQYGKSKGKFQSLYTYLERGINSIHSRFTLGESYTGGEIFESIPFRGVKVESDDSMVSYEQRTFSPIVRGIARTQARVEVRQNGYLIDSVMVPAGKFELTNLQNTGSSGELKVSVFENDGSVQYFTVPYTAPAIALRDGYLKYSISSGTYRASKVGIKPNPFTSFEAIYGLPWNITAYGGFQGGRHYQATSLGSGLMLGAYGAISLDSSVSHSQKKNSKSAEYGTRWRLRYSNYLNSGMSFLFSGEEYESKGFHSLTDTFDSWCIDGDKCFQSSYREPSLRNQFAVNLSQSLNGWGNITLSGTKREFWGSNNKSLNYSLGYSKNIFHSSTLSLNWSKSRIYDASGNAKNDYLASLWLSVPLSNGISSSYQMINQKGGRNDQEFGIYGDVSERQLHWDVREKFHHERSDVKTSSALRLAYKGTYGEVGGSYYYSKYSKQMGLNMQGNLLLTKESGFVASQQQGDTLALVTLPGVSGAKVGYWAGVQTDFRGYTTTGYLQPYNRNRIYVNSLSLPSDVSLSETETSVVPTKGAVVIAKLAAKVGKKALVYIELPDGKPAPFGSVVTMDGESNSGGIVGEDGSVYLTGISEKKSSKIKVQWGRDSNKQCKADILIPDKKPVSGIYQLVSQCTK
ncbi:fimbria/pilus outer membrane usher protein [Hafnia paralvei]|uniref:fimbria/pilus outer membrane usher protein n=1 Tax=Hafnia paralvei TaxID=546367 RepID=UPI0014192E2F|nr:fimbria/pilus outer membrane usher protein [Hafnia paralvei]NIH33120.1 fimbria/pilus outer membrane usher protein [Hafnia paralvei]